MQEDHLCLLLIIPTIIILSKSDQGGLEAAGLGHGGSAGLVCSAVM